MTKNNNPDQVACKVQGKRKMKWKSQLLNRFYILLPGPLQYAFLLDYIWQWPFLGEEKSFGNRQTELVTLNKRKKNPKKQKTKKQAKNMGEKKGAEA